MSAHAVAMQLLAAALLGRAVFAAVHHAEVLALRLGEPFGSILLAVAVTVIELGLMSKAFKCMALQRRSPGWGHSRCWRWSYALDERGSWPLLLPFQTVFVGAVSLALYAIFVFVQTVEHREYFLDVAVADETEAEIATPSGRLVLVCAGLHRVAECTVCDRVAA